MFVDLYFSFYAKLVQHQTPPGTGVHCQGIFEYLPPAPPPPPPSRLTLAVGSLCEEDDPGGGTKLVHANSLPRPPRPPVQLLDLDMRNRTKTEYFPALCRRNFVINPR